MPNTAEVLDYPFERRKKERRRPRTWQQRYDEAIEKIDAGLPVIVRTVARAGKFTATGNIHYDLARFPISAELAAICRYVPPGWPKDQTRLAYNALMKIKGITTDE